MCLATTLIIILDDVAFVNSFFAKNHIFYLALFDRRNVLKNPSVLPLQNRGICANIDSLFGYFFRQLRHSRMLMQISRMPNIRRSQSVSSWSAANETGIAVANPPSVHHMAERTSTFFWRK